MSQHHITVLPVEVSLTYGPAGEVQLHNDAPYDIDISGYVLRGTKEVVFPPRSILLTRATITIEAERLGKMPETLIALFDTKKNLVTSTYQTDTTSASVAASTLAPVTSTNFTTTVAPTQTRATAFSFITPSAEASTVETDHPGTEVIQILPDNHASALPTQNAQWPYYALLVILLLATGVLFTRKTASQTITGDDHA